MSTWKKLCERRDRNEATLDMYIWKQEFDNIRAIIELARKIDERRCHIEEIIDYPLNDFIDLSAALKDLGVLP